MTSAKLDRRPWRGGRAGVLSAAVWTVALPILLGACSSFLFEDEELEPQRIQVQSQRAEDPAFPNLASVPDQRPQPSASAQRGELLASLSADREGARYSDQPLTPESAAADDANAVRYPPPPSLEPTPGPSASAQGEAPSARSQSAARDSAPPPPDIGDSAALEEPRMPPPPELPPELPQAREAAAAASPSPPSPSPPSPSPPSPSAPSPSPPSPSPPPAATPQPPVAPEEAAASELAYPAPTGLLQERAFQQQAQAQLRLQQLARERLAFDQQARQEAIEQQWQRERLIQQHRAQWRYPSYAQQAAVPALAPAAGPQAPLAGAPPAYAPPLAPVVAPGLAPVLAPGQLVALIYFGHGSARLDARDRQVLQQVAALQQMQGRGLRVIGHASARTGAVDPARHQAANQKMSLRRAQAVADVLARLGADRGRIAVDGAGDAQPVYHEFTPTGEAGNRRVEIFLE